jgi:hypothetical protein
MDVNDPKGYPIETSIFFTGSRINDLDRVLFA